MYFRGFQMGVQTNQEAPIRYLSRLWRAEKNRSGVNGCRYISAAALQQ